ncbi:DUF3105 domain-containing protein [Candidatus Giovannonibacteria bacterium]|nr:DUF3105 domain-containing protein [Candidatus Giovannonibacteria bacterium]
MENINQEENLSKKERKEFRREEKKLSELDAVRRKKMKKIFIWLSAAVALLLISFLVWLVSSQKAAPLGEDLSKAVPEVSREHIKEGDHQTSLYNSNPPTSGPHWGEPLSDGIYDVEKPDEAILHGLEHGRIWISYKPDIPGSAIAALKALAKSESRVILEPRSANDADIALAAWARLDKFDLVPDGTFDAKRITDFIKRYRDKGPEFVPQDMGKEY